MAQVVKNLPAIQETDSSLRSGSSPGGGNGNPLQYACLENPMERRVWQATVHGVAKNHTWLNMHALVHACTYMYTHMCATIHTHLYINLDTN